MISFYNSLSGQKEPFDKTPSEKVRMYVCGPTVYDKAHLGHGRSGVAFDLVRRLLLFQGFEVDFVFNMTDIDDKMIKRASEEGITVPELAERIIPLYHRDYLALRVLAPTHEPRATEYVQQMIDLIVKLEEKGAVYVLEDGVYYDITAFSEYGKLSHQKLDELNAGARVEAHAGKRQAQDFVLWKFKKEGEPSWESPWGDGRPGWHIECSAMSHSLLGEDFDIHGGGLDLKFPHHECEIAQSELALGARMSKFWMHNGYVTVDKEKMSKSLGNFFTLEDLMEKFSPRVLRYFLIGTHYRSPIEFNLDRMEQAAAGLRALDEAYFGAKSGTLNDSFLAAFVEKLENDVDIAGALAVMHEHLSELSKEDFMKLDELLGVFPVDFVVSDEAEKLLEERNAARAEKDYTKSDELRGRLSEMGYIVKDGADGSVLRPLI